VRSLRATAIAALLLAGSSTAPGTHGAAAAAVPPGSNGIATLDEQGVVTLLDATGAKLGRFETGVGSSLLQRFGTSLLYWDDGATAALFDTVTREVTTVTLPSDRLRPRAVLSDPPVVVLGPVTGGDAFVVGDGGQLWGVGAAAGWTDPMIFTESYTLATPSGSHVAVSGLDGRDEATAIVAVADGSAFSRPGRVATMDAGSATLAAYDPSTGETVLRRFDLSGNELGAVSIAGQLTRVIAGTGPDGAPDGSLVVLTDGGQLSRADPADGTVVALGDVVPPDQILGGAPSSPGGGAALLAGADDTAMSVVLIRGDGSWSTIPITLAGMPAAVLLGPPGGCVVAATPSATLVARVSDGSVIAALMGPNRDIGRAFGSSSDRCTVPAGPQLVTPDGAVNLPLGRRAVLVSPNGDLVVVHELDADERFVRRFVVPVDAITEGVIDEQRAVEIDVQLGFQLVDLSPPPAASFTSGPNDGIGRSRLT